MPISGIGLYPRLLTDSYRASIEALVQRETTALSQVRRPAVVLRPELVAMAYTSPALPPPA